MSPHSPSSSVQRFHGSLFKGLAIGITGGIAEVLVVWSYSMWANVSALNVARHIASTVGLDGTSAWAGLTVHMLIAALLGVAIAFAWQFLSGNSVRLAPLYSFALLALSAVWAINFLIVLPVLSPSFVTLLPLSVTFVSKLAFGFAAATGLRILGRKNDSDQAFELPGTLKRAFALGKSIGGVAPAQIKAY
jgi:hypothetical protein